MSLAAARIEQLCRDLVVEHSFSPLEKVLPAAGRAAGLFNACLARLDSDRLELHAFLAWHGQDALELEGRSAALRQALEESSPHLSQRVTANLFLVAESSPALAEAEAALKGVKQGHFLEKILIAPAGVALSEGRVDFHGRIKPRPGVDWFEQHFVSDSGHAAAEAEAVIKAQDGDEANARRLLARGETWATWSLIAVNIAAFLSQYYVAASLRRQLGPGADPGQSLDLALQALGANQHELVFGKGQWWRLLSCMFLHAGELHLVFNMASLFSLGAIVEKLCGPAKFLLIYFAAGLGGSLLSAWHGGEAPSVGASGAIFGLAGALMALNFRRPPHFPLPLATRIFKSLLMPVALTFGLGLMLALGGEGLRFDNWAHFGGLFTGFALVYAWPSLLQKSLRVRA